MDQFALAAALDRLMTRSRHIILDAPTWRQDRKTLHMCLAEGTLRLATFRLGRLLGHEYGPGDKRLLRLGGIAVVVAHRNHILIPEGQLKAARMGRCVRVKAVAARRWLHRDSVDSGIGIYFAWYKHSIAFPFVPTLVAWAGRPS